MIKRICKILGIVLSGIILLAAAGIGVLTAAEYRPEERQPAERIALTPEGKLAGKELTICTWNVGYGGLGRDSDFFMDGGTMVYPPSSQMVGRNLAAITRFMQTHPADAWLLQEVDVNSARTSGLDQFQLVHDALGMSGALAYNYNCPFVPFPLPPIGRVQTGVATFTALAMKEGAERISLPCPFTWPVRTANMKRCLLVSRVPVEGEARELVLVNLHLEAYESGEGRIAQTRELLALLEAEYAKGNYVIAGGDFNQSFPGALEVYPIKGDGLWAPGELDEEAMPEGWRYAADLTGATCRLLDAPYSDESQLYVIDGFILSPNVEMQSVETVVLDFAHSDHHPVRLKVKLL